MFEAKCKIKKEHGILFLQLNQNAHEPPIKH